MAAIATLSQKFQISIPKAVRDEQRWQAGQVLREAGEEHADQLIVVMQLTCDAHFAGLPGVLLFRKSTTR